MKKNKKFISLLLLVLSTIFCIGSLNLKPNKNTFADDEQTKTKTGLHQIYAGGDLEIGDVIQFGEYPQKEITTPSIVGKLKNDISDSSKFEYDSSTGYYKVLTNEYSGLAVGTKIHVLDYRTDLSAKYPVERIVETPTGGTDTRSGGYYVDYANSLNNPLKYVDDNGSAQTTTVTKTNLTEKRFFLVEPLKWMVTGGESGRYQLTCMTVVDAMNFNMHDSNGNMWAGSYIRNWLNAGANASAFTDKSWNEYNQSLGSNPEHRNEYWGAANDQGYLDREWGFWASSQYGTINGIMKDIQNDEAEAHLNVLYGVNGKDSRGNKYYTHMEDKWYWHTVNSGGEHVSDLGTFIKNFTSEWSDYQKSSVVDGNQLGTKDSNNYYASSYYSAYYYKYAEKNRTWNEPLTILERLKTPYVLKKHDVSGNDYWSHSLMEPAYDYEEGTASAGSRNSVYKKVNDLYGYVNDANDARQSFYNMAFNSEEKNALMTQNIVSRGFGASQVLGEYVRTGNYKNETYTTSKVMLVSQDVKDLMIKNENFKFGYSDYAKANGFISTFGSNVTGSRSQTNNYGYIWSLNTTENSDGDLIELGGGQYYLDNYKTIHNNRDAIQVGFNSAGEANAWKYVESTKDKTKESGSTYQLPASRSSHPTSVNAMDQSYGVVPQIYLSGIGADYTVADDEGYVKENEFQNIESSKNKGGTQLVSGTFAGFEVNDSNINFKFGDTTKTATGYDINYTSEKLSDGKVLMFVVTNSVNSSGQIVASKKGAFPLDSSTRYMYTTSNNGMITVESSEDPSRFHIFVFIASADQRTIWQLADPTALDEGVTLKPRTIKSYTVAKEADGVVRATLNDLIYFFEGMPFPLDARTEDGTTAKFFNDEATAKLAVNDPSVNSAILDRSGKTLKDDDIGNVTYYPAESVTAIYKAGTIPRYNFFARKDDNSQTTKGIYYIERGKDNYYYPGTNADQTSALFSRPADSSLIYDVYIKYPYINNFMAKTAILTNQLTEDNDSELLKLLGNEGTAEKNTDYNNIKSYVVSNNGELNGTYYKYVEGEGKEGWFRTLTPSTTNIKPLYMVQGVVTKGDVTPSSGDSHHSVLLFDSLDEAKAQVKKTKSDDGIYSLFYGKESDIKTLNGSFVYFTNRIVKEIKYSLEVKKALVYTPPTYSKSTDESGKEIEVLASYDLANPFDVWFSFDSEPDTDTYSVRFTKTLTKDKSTQVKFTEAGGASYTDSTISNIPYDKALSATLGFNTGYYIAPELGGTNNNKLGFKVPAMSFSYAGIVRDENGFRYADYAKNERYNYTEEQLRIPEMGDKDYDNVFHLQTRNGRYEAYNGQLIRIDKNGTAVEFDERGNIIRYLNVKSNSEATTKPFELIKDTKSELNISSNTGSGMYYRLTAQNVGSNIKYTAYALMPTYTIWDGEQSITVDVRDWNKNNNAYAYWAELNGRSIRLYAIDGDYMRLEVSHAGNWETVTIPISRNGEKRKVFVNLSSGYGDFYIEESYAFVRYTLQNIQGTVEEKLKEGLANEYKKELTGDLAEGDSVVRSESRVLASDYDFTGRVTYNTSGGSEETFTYTLTVGASDSRKYNPWIEYVENVNLYDDSGKYQFTPFFKEFIDENGENTYAFSTGIGDSRWSGNRAWFVRNSDGKISLITDIKNGPKIDGIPVVINNGIGTVTVGGVTKQCFSLDALNVTIKYNTSNNAISIKYEMDHVLSDISFGFDGVQKYDYELTFGSLPFAETDITSLASTYATAQMRNSDAEASADSYDDIYYTPSYYAHHGESGILNKQKVPMAPNDSTAAEINNLYNVGTYTEGVPTNYTGLDKFGEKIMVYRPFFVEGDGGLLNAVYMYPTGGDGWAFKDEIYPLMINGQVIRTKKLVNEKADKYVFFEYPAFMGDIQLVPASSVALKLKGFRLADSSDANYIFDAEGKQIYDQNKFISDTRPDGGFYSVYYTTEQLMNATFKFDKTKGGIKFIAVYGLNTINTKLNSWYLDDDNIQHEENIVNKFMKDKDVLNIADQNDPLYGYNNNLEEVQTQNGTDYYLRGVYFNKPIEAGTGAYEVLKQDSEVIKYATNLVSEYAGGGYKGIFKETNGIAAILKARANNILLAQNENAEMYGTKYTLNGEFDTISINGKENVYEVMSGGKLVCYIRVDVLNDKISDEDKKDAKNGIYKLNALNIVAYEPFDIATSSYQSSSLVLTMLFQVDVYSVTNNIDIAGLKPGVYVRSEDNKTRQISNTNPTTVLSGEVTKQPLVLHYTLENAYSQNELARGGVFEIVRTKDGVATVLTLGTDYKIERGDKGNVDSRNTYTITINANQVTGDIAVNLKTGAKITVNNYNFKAINPNLELTNKLGNSYNLGVFDNTSTVTQEYDITDAKVVYEFTPNTAINFNTLKLVVKTAKYSKVESDEEYNTNTFDLMAVAKSSSSENYVSVIVDDDKSVIIRVTYDSENGKFKIEISNIVRDVIISINESTDVSGAKLKQYSISTPSGDDKTNSTDTTMSLNNIAKFLFEDDVKVLNSVGEGSVEGYIPYTTDKHVMYGDKIRYTAILQKGYLDSLISFNVNNDYLIPVGIINSELFDTESKLVFAVETTGGRTITITKVNENEWSYEGITVKFASGTYTFTKNGSVVAWITQSGANGQIYTLTVVSQFAMSDSIGDGVVKFLPRVSTKAETKINTRDLRNITADSSMADSNSKNGLWKFEGNDITTSNNTYKGKSYGDYFKLTYEPKTHYTQSLPELTVEYGGNITTYYIPGLGVEYENLKASSIVTNDTNTWYYSTSTNQKEYVYLVNQTITGSTFKYSYFRQGVTINSVIYYLNQDNKSVTFNGNTYTSEDDGKTINVDGVTCQIATYNVLNITLNAELYKDFDAFKDKDGKVLVDLPIYKKLCNTSTNTTKYSIEILCTGNLNVSDALATKSYTNELAEEVIGYSLNTYTIVFVKNIIDGSGNPINTSPVTLIMKDGKVYVKSGVKAETTIEDPYNTEGPTFGVEEGYSHDPDSTSRYIYTPGLNGNRGIFKNVELTNEKILGNTIFGADYTENVYNVKFVKPAVTSDSDTQRRVVGSVYSNLTGDKTVGETTSAVFRTSDIEESHTYKISHSGFYSDNQYSPNLKYEFKIRVAYDQTKPEINVGDGTKVWFKIRIPADTEFAVTNVEDPNTHETIKVSRATYTTTTSGNYTITVDRELDEESNVIDANQYKYNVKTPDGKDFVNFILTVKENENISKLNSRKDAVFETINYSIDFTSIISGLTTGTTIQFEINEANKYSLNKYNVQVMKMLFREVESISDTSKVNALNGFKNSTSDRIWEDATGTSGVVKYESEYYMYEEKENAGGTGNVLVWYNMTSEPNTEANKVKNYALTNAFVEYTTVEKSHSDILTELYNSLNDSFFKDVRGYEFNVTGWSMSKSIDGVDANDGLIQGSSPVVYDDITIYPRYTVKKSTLKLDGTTIYITNDRQITFAPSQGIDSIGTISVSTSKNTNVLAFTSNIIYTITLKAEYSKTELVASIRGDSFARVVVISDEFDTRTSGSGNKGTTRTIKIEVSYYYSESTGDFELTSNAEGGIVSVNTYQVKFYTVNGGLKLNETATAYNYKLNDTDPYSLVETKPVQHGKSVTCPTLDKNATPEGYTFSGWYLVYGDGKDTTITGWFNSNTAPRSPYIRLDGQTGTVAISNDVDAYAIYIRNQYEANYAYFNDETKSFIVTTGTARDGFRKVEDVVSITSKERYNTSNIKYLHKALISEAELKGALEPSSAGFEADGFLYVKYDKENGLAGALATLKTYAKDPNAVLDLVGEFKPNETPVESNVLILSNYKRKMFTVKFTESNEVLKTIEEVPFGTRYVDKNTVGDSFDGTFDVELPEYNVAKLAYGVTFTYWGYSSTTGGVSNASAGVVIKNDMTFFAVKEPNTYNIQVTIANANVKGSIVSNFLYQDQSGISLQFNLEVLEGYDKENPQVTVVHIDKNGKRTEIEGGTKVYYDVQKMLNTPFSLFTISKVADVKNEFVFTIPTNTVAGAKASGEDEIRFETGDTFEVVITPKINVYTVNNISGSRLFADGDEKNMNKEETRRNYTLWYKEYAEEGKQVYMVSNLLVADPRVFYVVADPTEHGKNMTINIYVSKSYDLRSVLVFRFTDGNTEKEFTVKHVEGEEIWDEGPDGYFVKRCTFDEVKGDITLSLDAQTEIYSNNYTITYKMAFGGGVNGWFVRSLFPTKRVSSGEKFEWTTDSTLAGSDVGTIEAKYTNNYKLNVNDFPVITPSALKSDLVWCNEGTENKWFRRKTGIDFNWANVNKYNFDTYFEAVDIDTQYKSNTELYALYFVETVDVNYASTNQEKAKFADNGAKADKHDPLVEDMADYGYKFKYIVDVAYSNSKPVITVAMNGNEFDLVIIPYKTYNEATVNDLIEVKKTDTVTYTVKKELYGYSYTYGDETIEVRISGEVYTFDAFNTIVKTNGSEYSITLNKIDGSFNISANDAVYEINRYKVTYTLPNGTRVSEEVEYNKNVVSIPEVSKNFLQKISYRVKYADGRTEVVNANTLRHINLTADMSVEVLVKLNFVIIAAIIGTIVLVVVVIVLIALRAKAKREMKLKNAKETSEAFARLTQNKNQQNNNNDNKNNNGENGPRI